MGTALIVLGTVALLLVAGSALWQFLTWQQLDPSAQAEQRSIKAADLAVHKAESAHKRKVTAAERAVTQAGAAPFRAKYGSLTLYDDHVKSGSQTFQLTAKTKAKVVGHGRGDQRRVTLLLEDTNWSRSLSHTKTGKPNEIPAQKFASEARVCAANAVATRARRQQAVTAARQQASATVADTAELDAARAARSRLGARLPASGPMPGRRWRRGAVPAALAALVVGVGVNAPQSDQQTPDAAAAAASAVSQNEEAAGTPTPDRATLRARARKRVANGDYNGAMQAVATLTTADRSYVRHLASNRAARVATNALRRGDRSAAHRALNAAYGLPQTTALRAANTSYNAAVRTASRARHARAVAAAERKAARRAAADAAAAQEQTQDSASDGSQYAGENCDQIGHSFTVVPGSDPEHDRDNDGIACESQ